MTFVENRGQTDASVRYYAQGNRYAFYLTPTGVLMSFLDRQSTAGDPSASGVALGLHFVDSNPLVRPQGADEAPGVVNVLRGNDPSKWHTGIPQFRDVVYPDLWRGVDLRLREESGVLKYEFHVAPGTSPAAVQLAYQGAQSLAVSADGGLQISTPIGLLQDAAPVSYQDIDGTRVPVSSRYVVGGAGATGGQFSFDVGQYRTDHELVIDPGIKFTTFLGGSSAETGNGIAVDANGNSFIAGTTQ
ncbi:MAG TPA: SBBP repeat-containing protein, partial [Ilumatobacteraceae bacterium]|nr:SBBP repeat-containing protein [Ilumatobacteraceae bacterium]